MLTIEILEKDFPKEKLDFFVFLTPKEDFYDIPIDEEFISEHI